MRPLFVFLVGLLTLCLATSCNIKTPKPNTDETASRISLAEAELIYDYAYPLIIMKISQDVMFTVPLRAQSGPNHFIHFKQLARPEQRAVVLGNRNTLYSVGWVDLSKGPVIFETPDMGKRYYVMPLLDAWTNTFKSLGSRTTGQDAQKYFLTTTAWNDETPNGFERIISPTNMVWITGRIQADSPEDAEQVSKLQDDFKLMTYHEMQYEDDPFAFYKPTYQALAVRKPVPYSLKMPVGEFYNTFFKMWPANPSPPMDNRMLDLLEKSGIKEGTTKAFKDLPAATQNQLTAGLKAKQAAYLKAFYDGTKQTEPWIFNLDPNMGDWGTDFPRRAYWAMWGLGTNISKDAVYGVSQLDENLDPLNETNLYRIHFSPNDTPPTTAFWSVTNYDADGYLERNKQDRYSLGSNHALNFNEDGSLDFYLSHFRPDIDAVNWVPSPKGNFKTLLRIYWPDETVLQGNWSLPSLEKVNSAEPRRTSP